MKGIRIATRWRIRKVLYHMQLPSQASWITSLLGPTADGPFGEASALPLAHVAGWRPAVVGDWADVRVSHLLLLGGDGSDFALALAALVHAVPYHPTHHSPLYPPTPPALPAHLQPRKLPRTPTQLSGPTSRSDPPPSPDRRHTTTRPPSPSASRLGTTSAPI